MIESVYQEKVDGGGDEAAASSGLAFVQRERTLQAVQIWSVGPNGVDDGGVRDNQAKDDIRFIVQIR